MNIQIFFKGDHPPCYIFTCCHMYGCMVRDNALTPLTSLGAPYSLNNA